VLLSDKELAILACFFPKMQDHTAKELETEAGLSHEPAFRTLKQLAAKGFLKEKKYGKTNVYKYVWREESFLVLCYANTRHIINLKEKRAEILTQARDITKQAHAKMTLLLPAEDHKDVSLICIGATHDLDTVAAVLSASHHKLINIIGKSTDAFRHLRKDDPELWERIMNESVILEGIETFMKEVYDHGL